MTRTTMVLMSAAVLVLSGCKKKTVEMVYQNDFERLAPVVAPGDVLRWDQPIAWLGATTPCEEKTFNTKPECTVTPSAHGKRFKYRCQSVECDPEIVVDEIRINAPIAAAGTAGTLRTVTMWCTTADAKGATTVDPSTQATRPGERIGWTTIDDYKLKDWKVTLQGDDKDKVCVGGKYEFGPADGKCTVSPDAPATVSYSVASTACSPGTGTIAVSK